MRAFAADVDVVTFDHEHVPQDVLRQLVADGVVVHPGPDALQYAQDKLVMRARLAELGVPQPDWAAVRTTTELQAFLDEHAGAGVVKTPRGGYDGKGVRVVRAARDAQDWLEALAEGEALLVEELVPFVRELAQQVARRAGGEIVAYPVVETVQRDGVCAEVIAPAPAAAERLTEVAEAIGRTIAEGLGVTGMLAVELFEDRRRAHPRERARHAAAQQRALEPGRAVTGQFEQHLRAVADLPLGSTAPRAAWSVMVQHPRRTRRRGRSTSVSARAMAEHPAGEDPHLREGAETGPARSDM